MMNEASRVTDIGLSLNSELEEIVHQIGEQARAGQPVDIAACCAQFPDHAAELRRVLPLLNVLAEIGHTPADQAKTRQQSDDRRSDAPGLGTLGDFQILREIGRGGMGIVYEAEQISLKRRVALKVLPFAAVLDNRQLQRFRTEAMAAARLHHQHIVPVHQVGCDRAVHFYAMQYIEGRNVSELIQQTRRVAGVAALGEHGAVFTKTDTHTPADDKPVDTVKLADISTDYPGNRLSYHRRIAELGIQAAQALDFAHQHGILHRDIKPSNLMLDSEGELWVTDFGLARIEGDEGLTMSGDLLGTLRYMSPEQALGKRVVIDQRTDVYSLGVSLYEMLTLHPAYDGADRAELLRQIAFETPIPPRKHDPSIPADLETIVLTAMAREPHRRYETAQELADDLQRFLDGKPIVARRPSRRELVQKWVARNKSQTALMVLLLVAVTIAVAAISEALSRGKVAPPDAGVTGPAATITPPVAVPAEPDNPARAPGRILPGLLPEPALIPDVGRWQLITKKPRGVIRSAVWSPDEAFIALAEANHVRIYDSRDLRLLRVLVGHTQPVRSVAWHPDGKRLASCSEDRTVRLWTATGKPTHVLSGHSGPVYQVAWRPDGERLASAAADGTVRLWSTEGDLIRTLDEGDRHVFGIDWSPDGNLLASVGGDIRPAGPDGDPGDNALRIWNPETSDLIQKIPASVKYSGLCVDWRPDGQQLAVGYGHVYRQMHWPGKSLPDAGVRIWNTDGTPGPEVGRDKGSVSTLAWSPNGEQLAFAGRSRIVRVWNARTLQETEVDVNQLFEFFSLSWSRDSTRLLIGHRDAVQEWDGHSTTVSLSAGIGRGVGFQYGIWSPDGKILFGDGFGSSGDRFWNSDGVPVPDLERPAGDVQAWWDLDMPNRRPGGLPAPALEGGPTADGYTKFAWSKDGWFAAATWNDQSVRIWDDQGKLVAKCLGHRGGVESVAWSPDGTQVVSGGGDSVRIWNRDGSPGPVMTGHEDEVYGVAWSPDGQWIASAGTDSTVRLWNAKTGEAGQVLRGHQGGVFGVGWSPDSKKLVSGSWLDNTLRVWDVASGKTEWQALRLDAETTVTITPAGFPVEGDPDVVASSLLYMVEGHNGATELLSVSDFTKRFSKQFLPGLAQRFEKATEAHDLARSEAELALALRMRADVDAKGRIQIGQIADQLGSALYFEREYGRAEQAFRAAIDIQEQVVREAPADTAQKRALSAQWLELGRILNAVGRNTEALGAFAHSTEFYEEQIKSKPDDKELKGSLAWQLYERAQRQPTLDAALADLDRVVELDPEITRLAWDFLYLLDELVDQPADAPSAGARDVPVEKQFEIAKGVYLEAQRRLPKLQLPEAFAYWLSSAPERFRDPELALQQGQRALELRTDDSDLKKPIARAQYILGDLQACLTTLDGIQGDVGDGEFIRAMAYQRVGKTTEALAALERGRTWSKTFLQTAFVSRWKDGVVWYPTPGMVRRLEAEAAAMLGVTDEQVQAAAPPAASTNP